MLDGLRHIRGFLSVAHWGSFTRAAAELHVSQPALTVQIQQLESALGATLFERTKRKVTLTQAGQELLAPLERILVDVESVMGTSRDFTELRRGVVTIAAVPSLAATLLPAVIGEFCQAYPGIVVRLKDAVGNLLDHVRSGEADVGIGGETRRDRSVAVEDLYVEPICAFAPTTHPLGSRDWVRLAEVADYPTILPHRNTSLRTILDRAFAEAQLTVRPFHETSHISTTIGMVNAGLGIAILPLRAVDCFLSSTIRCIEIRNPSLERRVVIATRAGRVPSLAVQRLLEILRRRAKALPRHAGRTKRTATGRRPDPPRRGRRSRG